MYSMITLTRVRATQRAQKQYEYYYANDYYLAQEMDRILELLDEGPIKWAHEQQTEKGLAHWVRVDLPGADKKSYGILWREMDDGTPKVTYIGLNP